MINNLKGIKRRKDKKKEEEAHVASFDIQLKHNIYDIKRYLNKKKMNDL